MKKPCISFCAVVVVVFMPLSCRAAFRGHRQSGLLAEQAKQNSSSGFLQAARPLVTSAGPIVKPIDGVAKPLDGRLSGQAVEAKIITEGHVQRMPRIYFLFLAVDKVSNFGVWKSFFSAAPAERYRALIHCKGAACKLFASESKLLKLVPTVDSSYCADLVSPMNQLLAVALRDDPGSANPADKFVFVSDSTLPAKPFQHVYDTLISRTGSDFCMFPAKDWADSPVKLFKNGEAGHGHELAVKTHQWMVLSRPHSERSVHLWNEGVMNHMMTNFKLNQATLWQDPKNRTFGDSRNFGCLDEYWHMYVLFGPWTITDASAVSEYHYNDLTNSPVRIKPGAGWQGACDTFALWSDYTKASFELPHGKSGESPFMKLYSSLDQASIPHVSSSGPAWWDAISKQGLKAIRDSDFLFVRKFTDKPSLTLSISDDFSADFASEYPRIVLAA